MEAEDYRHGPDLPSCMTLREHGLVGMFALRQALEADPHADPDEIEIKILVRDRGRGSRMMASWVEFEVNGKPYAMWRSTGALYEVDEHGAVADDPIIGAR